jgi:hypothetical protein
MTDLVFNYSHTFHLGEGTSDYINTLIAGRLLPASVALALGRRGTGYLFLHHVRLEQ